MIYFVTLSITLYAEASIWVNAYMIKSDKNLKIEDIESDETFT